MTQWVLAFLVLVGTLATHAATFGDLQPINSGYLVPGDNKIALSVEVQAATNETITSLTLECDPIAPDTSCSNVFGENNGLIKDIKLYSGTNEILITNDIDATSTNTATFTGSFDIDTSPKTITFDVFLNDTAPVNTNIELTIKAYAVDSGSEVSNSGNNELLKVLGVTPAFNSVVKNRIVYNKDLENKVVLDFTLTPSTEEDWVLTTVTIANDAANFDVNNTGEGVTKVTLWKSSDDNTFNKDIDAMLGVMPVTPSFNSQREVTFELSETGGQNTLPKGSTATQFFVTYDIGPSTNVLQNPLDLTSSQTEVKAQITAISGRGHDSDYRYGPVESLPTFTTSNNNFEGTMAGLVIGEVKSIFPSMNAAAGLTNVPMLSFKARSVGVKTNMHTLGIVNNGNSFDANGNQAGIVNLHLIKDANGGEYSGYGYDRDTKITETATPPVDAGRATLAISGNSDLTLNSGEESTYYVLADFGTSMPEGALVSLTIGDETRASADIDGDDDFDDDSNYGDLRLGRPLPDVISNAPTINVVSPQLIVHSKFAFQTDSNDPSGLYCDTDGNTDCLDGGGATKKLVAGMENLRMYAIGVDVDGDINGVSFEFESPNRYFSEESTGISAIHLFLDIDDIGNLSSDDIYLGGTKTFRNFGQFATVSNVSLPNGKDQHVLVVFDIGQRAATSEDKLSFRLKGVTASSNIVAGVFPNPVSPYKYDVESHRLELSQLESPDIPSSNVITTDQLFNVTATVIAVGSDGVFLEPANTGAQPLSQPRFYFGGKDGANRSYEFDITFNAGYSGDWGSSFSNTGTKTLRFGVDPVNAVSEGDYTIDMDVFYRMSSGDFKNHIIRLTRSKGAGTDYKTALELGQGTGSNHKPAITSDNRVYSWHLPKYIKSVTTKVSNKSQQFKNYASIPQGSPLTITFANEGRDIDPGSIGLTLNGATVKSQNEVSVDSSDDVVYFSYDATAGVLTLNSVGNNSGTVMLSANDLFGKPYPQAPFIFYTSTELAIEKVLVYPNPYSPSATPSKGLTLGFSLTQTADVSFKIYDSMGRELIMLPPSPYTMGYHTFPWGGYVSPPSKTMIGAGTYYIKLIAEAMDGTRRVATTKLAVY
ncbi:MAG: hypothetical protein ISQ13_03880 [Candidatus Margulisbacteria bacterium]|nr:hypothetical protein [Candidatus Margulisiibacteriota bacterium]